MSDSEGDFSDELLELAGATEKKRRKRQAQSKSSKRRKAESRLSLASDSDADQPESEEEDVGTNPYPLEGKYIDEADRLRLMELPEIQREDILAQRQEEMQRIQDKRNLDQMLRAQGNRHDETVSKAAKRQHSQRGATKEKTRKLDELRAKRKAKDEKKRTRADSPKRERSSSPMDMETSDEEEEDGQISKFEEQEEKERKLYNKLSPDDEPITIDDLNKCRLTRDMLAKFCMAPWFEDYIKGAWVRYLIGQEGNEPIYRICEVINLGADLVKPYKLNNQTVNQAFDLRHGKSEKTWLMDKVSNSPFTPREFERLVKVYEAEKLKLPSKRQLEKKSAHLTKLANQPMTESDIAAMLARKSQLQSTKQTGTAFTIEKSRLSQARTLALRRQDFAEVQQIDIQLAELAASAPARNDIHEQEETLNDVLAKVNERNRKANLEAVRKAELFEAERKRRERKLAASGTSTPNVLDPSARLKAGARLLNSRPGTPATPSLQADAATTRSVSPLPPSTLSGQPKPSSLNKSFEASVIESVEIDLGDF